MAEQQPPLGGPSLDAEEKAMKSGKGGMIAGSIIVVLLLVAAGAWAMMSGGDADQYGNFGRTVNGNHSTYWLQFWACSLQNATAYDGVRTNDDLAAVLDQRAARGTNRYGGMVRDRCLPKLAEMQDKTRSLLPPEDLREQIRGLGDAISEVRSGWSEYIAYLDANATTYDREAALEHVVKIEKGWYDYKRAFKAVNDGVRTKLGH
jgi:hypothetical protein